MAAMIWDSAAQAFVEAVNTPMRYDAGSGAWVETTGMVWDAESQAWTEKWSPVKPLYLYKDGDECTDVTGGWGNEFTINNYYGYSMRKMASAKYADHMLLSIVNGGSFVYSSVNTIYAVDMRKHSKMMAEIEVKTTVQVVGSGCNSVKSINGVWDLEHRASLVNGVQAGTYILEADVSAVDYGYAVIYIFAGSSGDYLGAAKAKKVWLE